jgi:hypothetical protein
MRFVADSIKRGTGGPPNTVRLALLDRKTGFQPVREDSASRLSANETTGWKPVGPDRWDAQYGSISTQRGAPPGIVIVSDLV